MCDEVSYSDNSQILDLFMATPIGVFSLLDEESKFPGASGSFFFIFFLSFLFLFDVLINFSILV